MTLWMELAETPHEVAFVDVGGVRTRSLRAGAGRPLLLLHGFAGHLELFGRVIAPLATRFEVHAIDLIGHGMTDKPQREYGIATYADHVVAYMDQRGLGTTDIIGQSLGGWVAAHLAIDHPTTVRRLVLSSPGGTHANAESMAGLRERTLAAVMSDDPADTRRRLAFVLLDPADITDELVEMRHRLYRRDDFRTIIGRLNRLQEPEFRATQLLGPEQLARIEAPTLIVWTSGLASTSMADDRWPAEEGRHWHQHIAGSRFELVQPCGHAPAWERPETFAALVSDFLCEG